MNRRRFLTQAAAGPFIFGLRELLAQDRKPGWLESALRRMKETGRCGIVLIIPDAKDAQMPFGYSLAALVDGDDRATHSILCEAVFICLRRSQAEGSICEVGDRNTRYLLDPSGRRLDADTVKADALASPDAFTASFGPFLRGADRGRLREQADRIRKTLSVETRAAVDELDDEDPETRDRASLHLFRQAERLLPFLADLSLQAEPAERRGRAADVIEAFFRASGNGAGPKLPFGCKVPTLVSGGCGRLRELEEGEDLKTREIVACGMARTSGESRRFLSFLKG